MKKKKAIPVPHPAAGKSRPAKRQPNPNLNAQTRKVLSKHYRAKHGVR
jgi:hypothetical protein